MAASKRPRARTASTSSLEKAQGTHTFKIADYSLQSRHCTGIGSVRFIQSAAFTVSGHDWCIRCYPNGFWPDKFKDYVAVYLALLSKNDDTEVRAHLTLRLVDQATGMSVVLFDPVSSRVFTTKVGGRDNWGSCNFMKSSDLEASPYMRDDSIMIECDVTVIAKKPRLEINKAEVQVPPSDLLSNLRRLLETKKGADVTFKVQDEDFPAHKVVLAMRSPVFDAELYGPMEEKTSQCITVEDMHPDVFRALLHFIYTDTMPDMEDFDAEDGMEMIRHLLVAADRYAIGRLKQICESILSKSLDIENVATKLALADQHHCNNLKYACVEFVASSSKIDNVVASQEYVHLKKSCPVVLVDMLENVTKRLQ